MKKNLQEFPCKLSVYIPFCKPVNSNLNMNKQQIHNMNYKEEAKASN